MKENSEEENTISKGLRAVLETMSAKQLKDFEQYLNFEPFDSNQRLSNFFQLIKRHFFQKKKPKTRLKDDMEKIGISVSQFNKFQTFLHQKLDQFLAVQQVVQNPHRYHSYTLKAYEDLGLDYPTMEKKWRQLRKKIQKDTQTLEHSQQLINLEHFAIRARFEGGAKVPVSYFKEIHTLIDQSYILSKLKYMCASVNEASLLNRPFPKQDILTLNAILASHEADLPAFGKAYLNIFRLFENPHQPLQKYTTCLEDLIVYHSELSKEENSDLYNYLLNLGFKQMDLGKKDFVEFVVKVYDRLIVSDLLLVNGEIPSRTYKNIVSLNCRFEKYDWCLTFIESNKQYIPIEDQSLLPAFCKGLVHFYSGDFVKSAESFQWVIKEDLDDHILSSESRTLLLKSYFHRLETLDMDELEELYRLVDSSRMYVRRNSKLSEYHKKCYLNFIHYFNTLLRFREINGMTAHYPDHLIDEIQNLKFITNKSWLTNEIGKNQ